MKNKFDKLTAFTAGAINGILGAGGGMLIVPLLNKQGLKAEKAHATALAVMLPLSVLSTAVYIITQKADALTALKYIPAGVAGAAFGAWLLPKLPEKVLRLLFGIFALWAGGRTLFK